MTGLTCMLCLDHKAGSVNLQCQVVASILQRLLTRYLQLSDMEARIDCLSCINFPATLAFLESCHDHHVADTHCQTRLSIVNCLSCRILCLPCFSLAAAAKNLLLRNF